MQNRKAPPSRAPRRVGQDQHFQPRVDAGQSVHCRGHRDQGWGPGPTVHPQEVGAELDLEDWGEENQQCEEWQPSLQPSPEVALVQSFARERKF